MGSFVLDAYEKIANCTVCNSISKARADDKNILMGNSCQFEARNGSAFCREIKMICKVLLQFYSSLSSGVYAKFEMRNALFCRQES